MANIKIIRRRIKSAQNISQITRAMQMVAASKMKKAQDKALAGKPYADKIYAAVRDLAGRVDPEAHNLLKKGESSGSKLYILISTNKGLLGGLNTNLFRHAANWLKNEEKAEFVTIGKKGESFVVKWGRKLTADFSQNLPFTSNVPAVVKLVVDSFMSGIYSEVHIIYSNFLTALKQEPLHRLILPITTFEEVGEGQVPDVREFLIEPDPNTVMNSLLPHYLENQIRSAIFEAEASEHSARMIAMKNATDAALDLMDDLTLQYNKARQEKITYEIADIVTARMAVE